MTYRDVSNLSRRTASEKVLRDKAFSIAKNSRTEWLSKRTRFDRLQAFK